MSARKCYAIKLSLGKILKKAFSYKFYNVLLFPSSQLMFKMVTWDTERSHKYF